jgi:hypothetical protein
MSEEAVMTTEPDTTAEPGAAADVIVGVMTLNNASTIEVVIKGIVEGLQQALPGRSAMVLGLDGGSQDGTPDMVGRLAAGRVPIKLVSLAGTGYPSLAPEAGWTGRDGAIRHLCEAAHEYRAQACLIVEGNVKSFTPQWIDLLGRPIYNDQLDYVVPLYRRHRYEGTLVTNLLYPLSRALYGKRLRYPSGATMAMSGRLARELLKKHFWDQSTRRSSVEGWITAVAMAEDYRVCHAFLGNKDQDAKVPPGDLAQLLAQSVGSVFESMEEYEWSWEQAHDAVDVPLYGTVESAPLLGPVHVGRMVSAVKQGIRDLLPLWEVILSPESLGQVLSLGMQESEEFHFPDELWVQIVYEFALAHHDQVLHRDHLLKSLTPLYLGRTASFVNETQQDGSDAVEQAIERLCRRFEHMKPYLQERWRWHDE